MPMSWDGLSFHSCWISLTLSFEPDSPNGGWRLGLSLPSPSAQPSTERVVLTRRVLGGAGGAGLADSTYLVLKPGATYQQWLDTPGFINDNAVVAAGGKTDASGAFRTTPGLERGRSYPVVVITPIGWDNQETTLVLPLDAPSPLSLPDIVARRPSGFSGSDSCGPDRIAGDAFSAIFAEFSCEN